MDAQRIETHLMIAAGHFMEAKRSILAFVEDFEKLPPGPARLECRGRAYRFEFFLNHFCLRTMGERLDITPLWPFQYWFIPLEAAEVESRAGESLLLEPEFAAHLFKANEHCTVALISLLETGAGDACVKTGLYSPRFNPLAGAIAVREILVGWWNLCASTAGGLSTEDPYSDAALRANATRRASALLDG